MIKGVIENKINEIEIEISKSDPLKDIGFFSGEIGIAIFYNQMYEYYKKEEFREKPRERLVNTFDLINEGYKSTTICSGISSVLIGIKQTNSESLVDSLTIEVLNKKVIESVKIMIERRNFDFLHGSTGIIWTLLLFDKIDIDVVSYYVDSIYKVLKKVSKHRYSIVQTRNEEGKLVNFINLSLSHGLSSIIITLAKIASKNISVAKAKYILTKLCNFIICEKLKNIEALYPSFSRIFNPEIMSSRLAWCYGDIGIMLSLQKASEVLDIPEWQNEAKLILANSIQRKSIVDTKVYDPMLCHGSGGLTAIFHALSLKYNDVAINNIKDYWLNYTLKLGSQKNGLAGFTKLYDNIQIRPDISVLSGIGGIGLMLLSVLDNSIPDWYTFFMID